MPIKLKVIITTKWNFFSVISAILRFAAGIGNFYRHHPRWRLCRWGNAWVWLGCLCRYQRRAAAAAVKSAWCCDWRWWADHRCTGTPDQSTQYASQQADSELTYDTAVPVIWSSSNATATEMHSLSAVVGFGQFADNCHSQLSIYMIGIRPYWSTDADYRPILY